MSINPLNDISKVYLEQVAVDEAVKGADTEMRKAAAAERKVGDKPLSKSEGDKNAANMKRKIEFADKISKAKGHIPGYTYGESLDPVGQEDADIDNDGDTDKTDKYLHKRRKAIGKAIRKRSGVKESAQLRLESYRNLIEVSENDENEDEIKEKKVENKIIINPEIKESIEELGGTLIEMVEVDEFDFIVEGVYLELLDEGYEEDEIEEALEYALTEAKVTFGHDTASTEKKKKSLLSTAREKLSGAKTAAKAAVARGARKVAKGALGVARKMEGGNKAPKIAERKPSTYRGAGAGTKERVSSGSYTPPTKKKAEKPSDPWEGSATAPEKPKTKKAPAPAAKTKKVSAPKKRKKSKLDSLLADIRSEETVYEALRSREERMARMMTDKDRQNQKKERELKTKADEIISTERALSKGRKKNTEKTYNTPSAEVRKLKPGQKKDTLAMKARKAMEEYEIDEKLNLKTAEMGEVIKDFQKSDAPQFKGRTKEERRQMAIAAKLTAERGGKKLKEQQEDDGNESKKKQMLAKKKQMMQKQYMLDKMRLQAQQQGKLPTGHRMEEVDHELEEGMTMKDFKANRRKLKRREASADAKKRGHVGKEWYNDGRTYSPDEAKRMRSNLDDEERSTRHRSSVDPEGEDSDYSANRTRNPKKLRKQAAMGEEFIDPVKEESAVDLVTNMIRKQQGGTYSELKKKGKLSQSRSKKPSNLKPMDMTKATDPRPGSRYRGD